MFKVKFYAYLIATFSVLIVFNIAFSDTTTTNGKAIPSIPLLQLDRVGSEDRADCSNVNYHVDAFVGTTLEGANACPSITLPENRSSCVTSEEEELTLTGSAYKGFLPPTGYDEIGSTTALKILIEVNIDNYLLWDRRPYRKTRRYESTKIDVFINNVRGAAEAIDFVGSALEGLISFNLVDSMPEVGIAFEYTEKHCGYTIEDPWNPQSDTIGLRIVYVGIEGDCGKYNVNNIIHEIFHALGYYGHSAIQNTVMTVGGTWVGWESDKGEIDDVTISVIKNLYALPPGTRIDLVPHQKAMPWIPSLLLDD